MRYLRWLGLVLLAILAAAPSGRAVGVGRVATVKTAPALDPAIARVADLPRMRSILVSVDGTLLAEQYFHGAAPQHAANLKSASKSIISLLVGIALDRGDIESVDTTLDRFFPDTLDDPAKQGITIEDLLTMRSGLETTSNRNYGRWVQSGNWVRHVLTRPLVAEPGTRMIYSTGCRPSSPRRPVWIPTASPAGIWVSRWGSRCLAGPPTRKGSISVATRCR
jgi:CubicO group peptidase (beta-lactamase class C family)